MKRCPKCKKPAVRFIEYWRDHSITFGTEQDGDPESEGILEPGAPYCVHGQCGSCGHEWRLRGVVQIRDCYEH